ncbi:lipid A export ATP-binding/permease protein MsbA [Ferrigenium kumadai]|uniref:Lipid A export ATP-binding/permease protein MsbA n=2 Tax=Ferrigenium kumadai TaxID=1682490 RepID=A0AAN1T0L4_9PROT|nr:lipid A export ATP-binding/permease protein MsbA [Ferrigenium kumadai]
MNMTNSQLYLRLLGYVKPYWRAFAISIIGMVVAAATEPLLPALLKPMLDGTFVNKDDTVIRLAPYFIVGIFFVRGVATFVSTYAINWVGNKLVMDLRDEMFRKLLSLPTRYYDDHATGILISKLTFDVTQVTAAATTVVTITVRDSIIIAGLLGWLFYLNWKLTLLTLVMAPVIAYIIRTISKRMRNSSRDSQRAMGDITQVIEESVTAHKVVKLFGGQQYERGRFHDQANWVRRYTMKQAAAAAANVPIVQMVAAIALAVIVYLVTLQSKADETTVGGFLSFIAAMLMLTAPIKRLTGVSEFLQRGLAAAESVFELIDTESETDCGTVAIGRVRGELQFDNVQFFYAPEARPALQNISLHIRDGENIALVGASGSGKTTLANLVPRFYTPTGGRITLDGHDIHDLTLASLRANIALVSQEVVLFNDTVAANIAYGQMREVSEDEIVAAATAAHAMEFIREWPEGLDTLVGERGVKLSGGQRQRIAIARAILKDAPILILDEATSALDSESERHVQAALETLMQGRTTLVIAHRLSTIEKADRIVVMQKGEIAETGTHRELLARDGVYAQLHRIQFNNHGVD